MSRAKILVIALVSAGCLDKGERDTVADDTAGDDTGGPIVYDPGCITVDGEGGYAWLNDAIAVADEGATIALCAESAHEEAVVVDKAVDIVGPGPDQFVLVAPTNMTGFDVTASGASISSVAISTTRSGVDVTDATDVTLSDILVLEAGTFAVKANGATGLTIDGSTFMGNSYGGIEIDGGSATVSGCTITQNTSYGVKITGGADVVLSGNDISGSVYTDASGTVDGVGVYVEEYSSVTTSGNTIADNDLVNVFGDTGNVEMNGDTVTGSLYGAVVLYGDASFTDLTVDGAVYMGLWAVSQDDVSVVGVDVTVNSDESVDVPYDEWGVDGILGTGLAVVADNATISDVTVEGYNDCGIYLGTKGSGAADLEGVTITDVGRYGIVAEYVDATVTDTTIEGVRDPDDVDETDCVYVNYIAGLYAIYASVDWQGGGISGSDGWGMAGVYSDLVVSDGAFDGGGCAGIVGYESSLVATSNSFTNAPEYGSIYTLYSAGDYISGNTFSEGQYSGTDVYEYDYLDSYGYLYRYTYYDQPKLVDVVIYDSASATISGNTFEHGDSSLQLFGVDATITDNTWTDYRADVLTLYYYYDASGTPYRSSAEITGNTIDGFSGNGFYCYTSDVEMEDNVFTNGTSFSYTYDYYYEDTSGNTSSYTFTSSYTNSALYLNGCAIVAESTEISNLDGRAIYLYSYSEDGTYEFDDLTIDDVGKGDSSYYSAVYFWGYYGDTALTLANSSITNVQTNSAVELYPYDYASSGYDATISLVADNLVIDGTELYGIYANGSRVDAELNEVTISNTGGHGVYGYGGNVVVNESTISGALQSGMYLSGTTGSVTNSTITGNAIYGMQCTTATIDDCSGNDLSGNTMGEQFGCGEECGVSAE